jgi:endoglucanase
MQTNIILAAIAVFAAAQLVRPVPVPVFAEEALAPVADVTSKGTTWRPGSEVMMLPAGPFFTKGNQIVDRSGNPVRIASVGFYFYSGSHDLIMAKVAAAGFNSVRLSWFDFSLASDLADIDRMVAAATRHGVKVIIDHHGTNRAARNGGNNPNGLWYDVGGASDNTDGGGNAGVATDAQFVANWVKVAQRYAGNSTVIGFDLDNEPSGYGICTWEAGSDNPAHNIRWLYERVGKAIQAVNPDALIICEGVFDYHTNFVGTGPSPGGDLSLAESLPVVLPVPNKVVYSAHWYPSESAGYKFKTGTLQSIKYMNNAWGYLVTREIAPVWIGEWGASLDGSNGHLANDQAWAQQITAYMNGRLGAQGGPTFSGREQGMSGSWWTWGYTGNEQPHGTLNADGSLNAARKAVWSQSLFTIPPSR